VWKARILSEFVFIDFVPEFHDDQKGTLSILLYSKRGLLINRIYTPTNGIFIYYLPPRPAEHIQSRFNRAMGVRPVEFNDARNIPFINFLNSS